VGADSVADLRDWQQSHFSALRKRGLKAEQFHTTRMIPKRREEVLDGGSLYWVIKGSTAVRQVLADIRPFTDHDGVQRCNLVLKPELIPVAPRPRRPFQGWRYLEPKDAPPDIGSGGGDDMPEGLRRELAELGLL
jgi:hypothetical protein